MAFALDDIIIDRIQMAIAEKSDGTLLYTLTQLSEATIETTAESKEARDANGSLIKTFYQGKAGTFTATNAMLNLNVLAAATGNEKEVATNVAKIQMPKIVVVKQGTSTSAIVNVAKNEDLVAEDGTVITAGNKATYLPTAIKVNALGNNGTMGKSYSYDEAASSTAWTYDVATGVITLPTDSSADKFVIKFQRKSENAVKVTNSADKFPSTVKLTLKALAIEPCTPDVVRSCYVIIPSFQVSPEVNITLNTEGTLDYTGAMQVDYCGDDKELYTIVMCEDDEE